MSDNKPKAWTDSEKIALLTSIVAAAGPFKWENVALPAGRTRKACLHVYTKALQEAKEIPMGDGADAEAVKKRRSKKSPPATTKGASKGKRGRKEVEETVHESDVTENEEPFMKKVKEEAGSDDGKTTDLGLDEV
ncbi:MAG: hypothetical protein Q9201_007821 [Fulgogasparrea decipioides]